MELRWVLLGLGLLVILGILLFGQGILKRPKSTIVGRDRHREPPLEPPAQTHAQTERPGTRRDNPQGKIVERKPSPRRLPDKVVAVRIVPRSELPSGEKTVLALRALGLEHGQFGIFHKHIDAEAQEPLFSVARLTEPGSFDLTRLAESNVPGLSVFLALPGGADPVERFDAMMETARALARELDAELFDEKGSSWSVQRERYLREEMIQYRHHHERM